MTRVQIDESLKLLLRAPPENRTRQESQHFDRLAHCISATARKFLAQKKMGLGLTEQDIEEVVADGIRKLWFSYRIERSDSPTALFNTVVNNGATDRLRQFISKKAQELRANLPLEDVPIPASVTGDQLSNLIDEELHAAVGKARETLTPRERLAYDARFQSRSENCWTDELVKTHGKDASYWRKASCDAVDRIAIYLKRHGLIQKEKGDERAAL